jgi:effector-binding domain-containing protein
MIFVSKSVAFGRGCGETDHANAPHYRQNVLDFNGAGEYRPHDADLEACMPFRKPKAEVPGISIRELPGGRCVSLMHKGPYDQLGRSYARVLDYVRVKGLNPQLPSREVYHKGRGMIFKGNPQKYLTEILDCRGLISYVAHPGGMYYPHPEF